MLLKEALCEGVNTELINNNGREYSLVGTIFEVDHLNIEIK